MSHYMIDPTDLWKQWLRTVNDSMKMPQSPEQLRRDWLQTLKTDELFQVHDDVIQEIKTRSS